MPDLHYFLIRKNLRTAQSGARMRSSSQARRKEPAMLLLLRFTGHKKIANILSLLTTVAGLTLAVSPTATCG
jgi:hypothetical protein